MQKSQVTFLKNAKISQWPIPEKSEIGIKLENRTTQTCFALKIVNFNQLINPFLE